MHNVYRSLGNDKDQKNPITKPSGKTMRRFGCDLPDLGSVVFIKQGGQNAKGRGQIRGGVS